jgi:transcriptional regulator with XRE-family HTH domain
VLIYGEKIRAFRMAKGITQKQLGEAIGRTESSIAKYEQGKVEMPMSILEHLASVLSVDVLDIAEFRQSIEEANTEKRFTLRIDRNLFNRISASAKMNRRSIAKEIECAIEVYTAAKGGRMTTYDISDVLPHIDSARLEYHAGMAKDRNAKDRQESGAVTA